MFHLQHPFLAEDAGPFDDMPQLADIPRPRIPHHALQSLIRDQSNFFTKLFPKYFQKVVGDQRDTDDPLAKRGEVDFNDFQAVVQIFPEFSQFHHFLKVNVGRGYDPDIDLYWFILPQWGKSLFLEET